MSDSNPFAPPSAPRAPEPERRPDDARPDDTRPEAGGYGAPSQPEGPAAAPAPTPVEGAPVGAPYAHAGGPYGQTGGPGGPAGPASGTPATGAPAYPAATAAPGAPEDATPAQGPVDSWGRPVPERPVRAGMSKAWIAPLVVLSLVAGAVGGWGVEELLDGRRPTSADLPASAGGAAGSDAPLEGVSAIAAEVLPSVVSIEVRGADGQGTGSGFVLREDGYILTNNHVVSMAAEGAADVAVLFSDGTEETAELVGRTVDYDLAVLKVDRDGLRPLPLADSDQVVVGDTVVAVGAPLGLQGTVTTGIVSALNRPVSAGNAEETAFINAIQTDAAINPGNSGGPLVDLSGEVVGINSAIAQPPGYSQAGGSIGLGFAIPANQARRTAEELIETGTATYPVIGVLLDQRYTGEGVQVSTGPQEGTPAVTPGGPAAQAGIEPGDVITAIDGRPVTEADELIVAIRAEAPGDAVVLTVRRGDADPRDVRVVLDELPSQ